MKFTKSKIRRATKRYNKRKQQKTYKRASRPVVRAIQVANGLTLMNTVKPRPHFFKRTVINSYQIKNPNLTGNISGLNTFKLSDIPDYTDFTNLFEQYKFHKVKLTFKYDKAATTNATHPTFYVWKNNDTDLPLANITSNYVAQQANVKRYQFSDENREFQMSIYPYWLNRIYNTTATSGYTNNKATTSNYIDIRYFDVPHWGLAYFLPNVVGSNNPDVTLWTINVDVEYQFKFREQA